MKREIWKEVPIRGYEAYEVSTMGNVRHNGKTMVTQINVRTKRPTIALCKNGKHKKFLVHRLVAMAFIENPNGYTDVNHIDGNKQNNLVENLEWCSHSYNLKHAWKCGLKVTTDKMREAWHNIGVNTKNLRHIRKPVACYKNGKKVKEFKDIHEAFRFLGATVCGSISACCKGKQKSYYGYTWRYVGNGNVQPV